MDENLFNSIINISYAFIIGGLIVVFLTVGAKNKNALIVTITGYAAATCAVLLIASLTYTNIINGLKKPEWSNIILTLMPFILLVLIFGFSLSLVSLFFNKISENRVSEYYGVFSYISITFILLQIWLFFGATKQKSFRDSGFINKVTVLKLLLLAILNMLTLITLGITLKYFSTDG